MQWRREEHEGQKDRRQDKSVWRKAGGGQVGLISSGSVVCSSGPAGKPGLGEGGEGLKNFKTLHLHELDRPLENTRATIEKATLCKVKWDPSGDGTCTDVLNARLHRLSNSRVQGPLRRKRCPDTLQIS